MKESLIVIGIGFILMFLVFIWGCIKSSKEEENERNNIRDDSRR